MKGISYILLFHIGWSSATLMIYHEATMKEFGTKINGSKTSFGYSITYMPDNKRLVVSAPKASDHGAIFTCDIIETNCTSVYVNPKAIQAPKDYHIWLGATVRAGSNFFMTCAPRYRAKVEGIFTTPSVCYKYLNSGKHKSKLMSLPKVHHSNFKLDIFEYHTLTLGWSMDIDENDNALIGSPAMFTGHVVKYDANRMMLKKLPTLITLGDRSAPFNITNFGYSVTYRTFNSVKQIAISSTYGENGYGMVLLYNDRNGSETVDPVYIGKIEGIQVGAMFGASLCAARVDSKGQALLLVGAPTYARENKYDNGAVFIYKDEDINIFNTVEGTSDGGQFGYTLANLGDLNGDNKDEIAISAPFEDDGRGAVYIYSGAQLMNRDKEVTWLQRIQRSEYRSFGLSLYAIPDHDRNGCKELAIGIPESNNAVLLHCIPTITVDVMQLNLKDKKNNVVGMTSFVFESCLAVRYPELPESVTAKFSVKVNIPNFLIQLPKTGQTSNDSIVYDIQVNSDKSHKLCEDLIISVPTSKTYDPTLHYQISAVLLDDPRIISTFDPSRVTVSDLSKLTLPGTTWIGECEDRDNCIPNLEMKLALSVKDSPYVVGSTEVETVKISIKNTGDPAYEACAKVFLYGVNPLNWPPSCVHNSANATHTMLMCSPVQLLRNNTSWDINEIKLDMRTIKSGTEGGKDNIDVHVDLYAKCGTIDSMKSINVPTPIHWNSEHVNVIGTIKQGGVINITRNEIIYSSKQIQHEYVISNNGPTTWNNVKVIISVQKELYLQNTAPTSDTSFKCKPSEEKDMMDIYHCIITTIKKNATFVIVQPIDVMPEIYNMLKKEEMKVTSNLKMWLNEDVKYGSVITTLHLSEIDVPTWIIIIAVLFALLIIAIIIFALHECGFLKRKQKEKLGRLRKSVYRQSMRRSTTIQHNVDTNKEINIDPAEEATPDNEGTSTSTIDVNDIIDKYIEKEDKNETVQQNFCNSGEKSKTDKADHESGEASNKDESEEKHKN